MKANYLLLALAVLGLGACDFDITNPNNPDPIGTNPSRQRVANAAAGILIASRQNAADFILDVGIIGREAYRFDGSDPRFVTELLGEGGGALDPGSRAFGGDHWLEHYTAIASANELLNVIGTATALSAAEQNATRGFAETMEAWNYLMVVVTHTEDSIPVDVDRDPVADAPPPFVSNDSAYRFIAGLLDTANAHLTAGGTAFPFTLSAGFSSFGFFDTPVLFRQFNRALKARVQAYRASRVASGISTDAACGVAGATCYADVLALLAATWIDTSSAATLNNGVYNVFGTGAGDTPNALFQDPQRGENFAHPQLADSAEPGDLRFSTKVVSRPAGSSRGLTSSLGWIRYGSPAAPIPIIRNEELILLRAEANNALGNATPSADDINYVRVKSGGLAAIATLAAATPAARLNQILHERRYSLLYEGGHRWIDMRRFGRVNQLPIDRAGDLVFSTYPVPSDELIGR
ncbi:MAG TPA: RagB/SusD family nutrient uptake outer membrane protein [Gemmatimonadales bacterium]|jgi:hypothetical protein|nr:RagB/SusD family nutrient uptake outer membrane protein [Gemmatimonadales bacterium]